MTRIPILLAALTFVLLPVVGLPQDITPFPAVDPSQGAVGLAQGPPPFSAPPFFATRRAYPDEMWRLRLNGRVGHQWMNFNVNFPFLSNPNPFLQTFAFERLRLTLQDANYWVGFAGLELQPVQNVIAYGRIGSNVPKNSTVLMDATGVLLTPGEFGPRNSLVPPGAATNGANTVSPWLWDTKFFWWMMEGGLAVAITGDISLEAGFRAEHIDFKLTDPRNFTESTRVLIEINPATGLPEIVTTRLPPGIGIPCNRI